MKRVVATLVALTSTAITLSNSVAQRSDDRNLGVANPVSVRAIESVSKLYPAAVHIVIVTDNGSRMTLQMDMITRAELGVAGSDPGVGPAGRSLSFSLSSATEPSLCLLLVQSRTEPGGFNPFSRSRCLKHRN